MHTTYHMYHSTNEVTMTTCYLNLTRTQESRKRNSDYLSSIMRCTTCYLTRTQESRKRNNDDQQFNENTRVMMTTSYLDLTRTQESRKRNSDYLSSVPSTNEVTMTTCYLDLTRTQESRKRNSCYLPIICTPAPMR